MVCSWIHRRRLAWIIGGLVVMLACFAAWGTWWEDWDFHRPAHPLQCKALAPDSNTVRFIAFGDYGQGTPFQMQLAEQMARRYQEKPFELALLLGDNIYEDGDIKRYAKPFFEIPYAPLIRNNVRFIAALGNHDDRDGNREDQLAYFKMPNDYYKVSQGPVDFFILNTTFFVRNPEQREWIEESLAKSKARWKIVVGHHPLYSSGRNGSTEGLGEILEPLMIRHGVDLYLSGHDHDYERFKPIAGIRHVVSGGGGGFLTGFQKILPESLVHLRTHHFLLVEITDKALSLKAINRFNDVIDCESWEKP